SAPDPASAAASAAAIDRSATISPGPRRSSNELRPGSCASAAAGSPNSIPAAAKKATSRVIGTLRMSVVPAVLWRRFVGEHFVERHVVPVDVVAGRPANDRRTDAQIADERRDGDVDDVVTKPPAVRPSAWNNP